MPSTSTFFRWCLPVLGAGAAIACIVYAALQPGVSAYVDANVHLCWMQTFHDALADGVLQPRWSARDFNGLGAPVFVFYPPLAYYLGAIPMALGVGPDDALKFVYVAAALGTAGVLYGWLRDSASRPVALAFAALAVVLPQFSLFAWRFNMPASAIAIPAAALALWMIERVMAGNPRAWLGLTIAFASTILAHTISAVLLGGLLGVGALLLVGSSRYRRCGLHVLAALIVGAAITAFQWLPAWLAVDSIQANNFVEAPTKELVSNLLFGSDEQQAPWPERRLVDVANTALLLWLGLAIVRITRSRAWAVTPALPPFAAAAVLLFALMTPLARPLYEQFESTRYLQYGWRWQPLFALCALRVIAAPSDVVRSSLAASLRVPSLAAGTLLFAIGAVVVGALPSRWSGTNARFSSGDAQREALACRNTPDEYLPMGVDRSDLHRLLDDGQWDMRTLSGRARLVDIEVRSHYRRYEIEADLPSRIRLRVLASPGWTATLDGFAVKIENPSGTIEIKVPAGPSIVELENQ